MTKKTVWVIPSPSPAVEKTFIEMLDEMDRQIRSVEQNDAIRKKMGHDFPGASTEGSYCRRCRCGVSFAPTTADPDFQPCPGGRE
jgi:hypothetical protein